MAYLKCLSSGSIGNSYIIECNNETLLLELGIYWKDILKGLKYNLSNIQACIVSHAHLDHSLSIPNATKSGLSVFGNDEVANTYKGVKVLPLGVKTRIGGFSVQPLLVPHNAMCYSFIVTHEEFGKLLFITDCADFKYKVKDCNHILIESNYSDDLIIDNMCSNIYNQSASKNHLEIGQAIDVLKHNYSSELQNVVLLHLSKVNANPQEFVKRVKEELCFDNVVCAEKGLELELNKSEF